jgi:hypothetical protein
MATPVVEFNGDPSRIRFFFALLHPLLGVAALKKSFFCCALLVTLFYKSYRLALPALLPLPSDCFKLFDS